MKLNHLKTGSKDVPLQSGKLRLYSMRFCPFAHRIHLVLLAKNIPHDVVYINLAQKPEWYVERIPMGKVPALVTEEGKDLYESLILAEYLDEKYPQRPLFPKDSPLTKAQDKILIDEFNKVIGALVACYKSPSMDLDLLEPAFKQLDLFEKELTKRQSLFFSGTEPGMVDYMIWPWCERLEMVRVLGGDQFRTPKERFRVLLEWSRRMLDDEAVKGHCLTGEQHAKHLLSVKAGTPDYDGILA